MLKAYKYRMYPNKEQREYFVKCFGCTRLLINADLNGSYQIIRKVFPNVKADGIVGLDLTPVMINL